jgi:hypothetical protein
LAVPPGFTFVDPAQLEDLGPAGEVQQDAVLVARRGETASPPVDLVVVKEIDRWGLSAEYADSFAKALQRLSDTPVEMAEVRLPVGSARRFAATVPVPMPDVDHPAVHAVVHWWIDVDGPRLNLMVSRLGDGDEVPEGDQIAETAWTDEPAAASPASAGIAGSGDVGDFSISVSNVRWCAEPPENIGRHRLRFVSFDVEITNTAHKPRVFNMEWLRVENPDAEPVRAMSHVAWLLGKGPQDLTRPL